MSPSRKQPSSNKKKSAPSEATHRNLPASSEKKSVFICVSGMSPAIITESLWALARETPPVIPDEVVVITTVDGAEQIERLLKTPSPQWNGSTVWQALRRAILGPGHETDQRLMLVQAQIIEVSDSASGCKVPVRDLRTPNDNAEAADFILEVVRRYAENPDYQIIASIAGGRKTMGALLHAAMSLLGKEGDRITHVLVEPPFDMCRDFFFPAQPLRTVCVGDRVLEAEEARLALADLPFVPLRNLFYRELHRLPGRFSALVNLCKKEVAEAVALNTKVIVCSKRPEWIINGHPVKFSVAEYVLLSFLADRARRGLPPIECQGDAVPLLEEFSQKIYEKQDPNDFADWRKDAAPKVLRWSEEDKIRKNLSSARAKLKKMGELLPPGFVERHLKPRRTAFDFPASQITFEE